MSLLSMVRRNVAANDRLARAQQQRVSLRESPALANDRYFARILISRSSLAFVLSQSRLMALVDATKIEQMLNNLIGNALKFSPPGSEVTVVLDRCLATNSALVEVKDRGQVIVALLLCSPRGHSVESPKGIPSDQLPYLFSQAVHRVTVRPTNNMLTSTKLGLSIVKRVLLDHGGSINVRSSVGVGSSFVVRLPLTPENVSRTDN